MFSKHCLHVYRAPGGAYDDDFIQADSGIVEHKQYGQADYRSHAEILQESSLNLFLRSGSMWGG